MRKVYVENNKVVVEVDGARVRYPLEIIRTRISILLLDLEEWRKYERLLTQLAPDAGDSAASSGIVHASAESTSQAESAPTQRG